MARKPAELTPSIALELLIEIAELESPVDLFTPVSSYDIDSISFLEWLYTMDDDFALGLDMRDDELFDGLGSLTITAIVGRLTTSRC